MNNTLRHIFNGKPWISRVYPRIEQADISSKGRSEADCDCGARLGQGFKTFVLNATVLKNHPGAGRPLDDLFLAGFQPERGRAPLFVDPAGEYEQLLEGDRPPVEVPLIFVRAGVQAPDMRGHDPKIVPADFL